MWLRLAAAGLDAWRHVGVEEVQRHLDVNHVILVDALKIDVQHLLLVGVPLRIAQQHGFLGAIDIHGQHGSMERLLAQRVVQRVVIQLDLYRGSGAAVDDAGNLAGVTQTAARTRTLQFTLGSNNFDFHSISPVFTKKPPRPGAFDPAAIR